MLSGERPLPALEALQMATEETESDEFVSRDFARGSALAFALISVQSLEKSLEFYRDVIGLSSGGIAATDSQIACDDDGPMAARAALLSEPGTPAGRVLLVEFSRPGYSVRRAGDRTTRGLWNLNFYVDDIDASTTGLRARGYDFWSEPVTYQVGVDAGTAREVVFEGPDGVAINLVQPMGGPELFTGRVRAEVARHGKTRTGYTPVATTSHCVLNAAAALHFYRDVLGMQVVLDEILGKPETNRFLARPPDARTHSIFVAGTHFFGKVALTEPQNFAVPERVLDAQAPNVGYLAQGFEVANLADAAQRLQDAGIEYESRPFPAVPGMIVSRALQLRIPGSGAFALLVQAP